MRSRWRWASTPGPPDTCKAWPLTKSATTPRASPLKPWPPAANAILEEAFAEWAARNAKDEALLRAFEASGQTLEAFADMYGMGPRQAGQMLERAGHQRPPAATA